MRKIALNVSSFLYILHKLVQVKPFRRLTLKYTFALLRYSNSFTG
jgi:hypothetical protein